MVRPRAEDAHSVAPSRPPLPAAPPGRYRVRPPPLRGRGGQTCCQDIRHWFLERCLPAIDATDDPFHIQPSEPRASGMIAPVSLPPIDDT
jgi:hypothetical protein